MKFSQAIFYGLAALVMASPAAIPFDGRRYWMPQLGLGLLFLTVFTIRSGAFRPKSALLLLTTFVVSGWLAYLIIEVRMHVFEIHADNWRDEPFVGIAVVWCLIFLLSPLYFPIVFVRGIIRRIETRFSLIGLGLWVLHTAVVFWFFWRLQEAY